MNKLNLITVVLISIALLSVLNSTTDAYLVSNQNTTNNIEDNMTVHPLYCNPPVTCPLENSLYIDAPWRVNSNMPLTIYGIINYAYRIRWVSLYDEVNNITLAEKTFAGDLYLNSTQIPYIINFSIDPNNLGKINNRARIKMIFTISPWGILEYNQTEGPINITISSEPIPTFNNWYYGDTHYHSDYTQNLVELGGPLPATMSAMNAIGLDWITVTDHSFTLKTDEKWSAFKQECSSYSNCLIGEEISCDNDGPLDYNHYLGYNITDRIYSGEYLDNGTSPLPCSDVVNGVNSQGGFGYTAHPFYREGYYKDGFGLAYRNIWQDYNLPFNGMEIWNHEEAIDELNQGIEKWKELLLSGRHIFISAGSDAHGDFNSALGKVRTACFAQNFTKDNIFTALKNGNCMMTDGPIVVFKANNHLVGGSFNVSEGDAITLNISWNSTNEFGNVTEIRLIRGEINGTETNETIIVPNNLSGNFILTSTPNNTYYRIEAHSIDAEGIIRRAYTNPIWVTAEPKPVVEKIPMDDTELALVARFENKYDYSLKNLFFDGEPTLTCDIASLRENLGLNASWTIVKCEKMILDNKRLMWAGFNNTNTGEKKIALQINGVLQYSDATYNEFKHAWKTYYWKQRSGDYRNYNWIAIKNGTQIFEINEIYNSNAMNEFGPGTMYFGTYIIHGFKKYEENTTAYFTYWGPSAINSYARNVYMKFDNKGAFPITNGYILNTKGIFQKKSFKYNATSFNFGSDGVYLDGVQSFELVQGVGFDPVNRTLFPVSQTDSIIICHADIDCNDGDLLTKDICTNAGTIESKCEHTPQEPGEINKPFTEMDANEVSKAIEFKAKHNASLSELYFDGWKNTTCNNDGILETLKLDKNWSVIQCQKFSIKGTLAMFAGLNNTETEAKYVAYQLGNVLVDETANYKYITETSQYPKLVNTITYYLDLWEGTKNNTKRFEIDFFKTRDCNGFGSCSNINIYGTNIIHGFHSDENKKGSISYSYNKPVTSTLFNILFDNYRNFSIDNYSSSGNIYETKTFNYLPLHGWVLGTFRFNYALYNRSLFPPYRANELVVGLESPAHLRAQDSIGRITGYFNGTYITEIPGSTTLDTEHEKYLLPANDSYKLFVEGYTNGNYSLKITRANGENSSIIYFKNISATNKTRDIFELNDTTRINVKTKDSEKNIIVTLDGIESIPESIEFTAAKNKSVSISISNWSALNESTTITETTNYAPKIISLNPTNCSSFGQWKNIILGVYATDQNNDSLEYVISFDGAELAHANETTYVLNETGAHTINFSVSDGLNMVSEEVAIYVIAPPKITIISPENKTYNTSNIAVNTTFEELFNAAWISLDDAEGQNYTNNASTISIYLNNLQDGTHKVTVYANNSLGVMNYSTVFFSINTTIAPTKGDNGKHCGNYKTHEKRDKDERDEEKEFCKELKPKEEKDVEDNETDDLETKTSDDDSD